MERIRFIEHEGSRVLQVDYSGLRDTSELKRVAQDAAEWMRREPPGSVLVLVDLSNVPYGLRRLRMLGEAAVSNREFVRARAVIGIPPVAQSAVTEMGRFS